MFGCETKTIKCIYNLLYKQKGYCIQDLDPDKCVNTVAIYKIKTAV